MKYTIVQASPLLRHNQSTGPNPGVGVSIDVEPGDELTYMSANLQPVGDVVVIEGKPVEPEPEPEPELEDEEAELAKLQAEIDALEEAEGEAE